MNSPLKRITAIFITIIILPVLIFMVYEVGSLNRNEEILKEIYHNQLDAILYSVNQYSDDIVNSWANKINMAASDSSADFSSSHQLLKLAEQNPAIYAILISDSIGNQSRLFNLEPASSHDSLKQICRKFIFNNASEVKKLATYRRGGFRKILPLQTEEGMIPLLFLLDGSTETLPCILIIDPELFIVNSLAPKMQAISQEKFIITAFNSVDHTLVYATDENLREDQVFNNFREGENLQDDGKTNFQLRDFWLLPDYYLGISMKEATIDELVRGRAFTNMSLIAILIVILIGGIVLVYRNIRREIQLSQAKSEFVSNVSHEIRTPLSLISMFAETLAMNRVKSEEKKKEYYDIIGKETNRLSGIVNRILNFSQMEAKKRRYQFASVNLDEVVDELLRSYDFHMENKGFTYRVTFREGEKTILADKEAISEAIINLLDNALKYSMEEKQIEVATGEEKGYAYVEVRDYGMGISQSHQKDIFDQFFRVPTGDVHNIKGSGLGLTLVKKIVEAHKGKITLDSHPGKGSTFRLYFPSDKMIKT